jgi:AAA domain/Bifunctional DNA primase/polymerase, N-terminal
VANNVAELRLTLREAGFDPIPVAGKRALLPGWTKKGGASAEEIAGWSDQYPQWSNTGILTARAPTIDIDIRHPEPAEAVEEMARDWFDGRGAILGRVGEAPKRAILFRTDRPFSKMAVYFLAPDKSEHKIEVLGDGQQVIVDGIHPDTKQPYAWLRGYRPGPIPWCDLPELNEEEAQSFVKLATEMLAEKFGFQQVVPQRNGHGTAWEPGNGPLDVDAALAAMEPNGASVNNIQPRVILSLLQKGIHPDDVIAQVVDATMEMADRAGLGWTREVEARCVTKRCQSSLHKLQSEYDPSTGVIPTWLAGEFHNAWAEALRQGRRPQLSRNPSGFYVRAYGPATNGRDHGAETGNDTKAGKHNSNGDAGAETKAKDGPKAKERPPRVILRPFKAFDPATLPPRRWLYGKHYQRRTVSGTIGSGGTGKTTLDMVDAVAMATARNLTGEQPEERCRVWLHNGEDSIEELNRRIAAICQHYDIPLTELEGWLFVTSGNDMPLKVAHGYSELKIDAALVEEITQRIAENEVDVAMFDPLVTLHGTDESNPGRMDAVIRIFTRITDICDCAVELAHHTRKLPFGAFELSIDDARGAGAIKDALRMVRILNVMSKEEANNLGINEFERLSYFRVDIGKANTVPPAKAAVWRKFESVELANGDNMGDHNMGSPRTRRTPDGGAEGPGIQRRAGLHAPARPLHARRTQRLRPLRPDICPKEICRGGGSQGGQSQQGTPGGGHAPALCRQANPRRRIRPKR